MLFVMFIKVLVLMRLHPHPSAVAKIPVCMGLLAEDRQRTENDGQDEDQGVAGFHGDTPVLLSFSIDTVT